MKKIAFIVLSAIAFAAVGCKENGLVPEEEKPVLVETVTLDKTIADGYTLTEEKTLDISEMVSVTPKEATDLDRIYSSSDEAVAVISEEGIITAVKEGSSVISITVGSRGKKAEFTLTVEKNIIAVESIKFDDEIKDGIELIIGDKKNIGPLVSVLPENATNKGVSFSSDKEEIASITAEGEIEAKAIGEATITVTAYGDKTGSIKVTVLPVPVTEITSIKFNEASVEYEQEKTTGAIDLMSMLEITPADQTEGIVFTSSDEETVSVDESGKMTVKKLGKDVTVTVAAKDHSEISAELKVSAYKFASQDLPRHKGDGTLEPSDEREYLMTMTCSIAPLKAYNGRNNSLHAMLDDKPIINRAGPGNVSDAAETNGTAFCFDQMKSTWAESSATSFTIDMKETKTVDYFRVMNISKDRDDCQVRICGFDKIEGSNDGENFEEIARDFGFENCTALGTTNDDGRPEYNLETENIPFPKTLEYRYLRFSFWTQKYFVRRVVGGTQGGSAQIAEFYLGNSKTKIYAE